MDLDIIALTADTTRNAPDALREAIVARARADSKALDGVGADKQPLAQQEALLRMARRAVEAELIENAKPKAATAEELAQWKVEKLAFGKKRSLTGQGELVKLVGGDKAAEIAKSWGTSLGHLVDGKLERGRNPHKKELKAVKQAEKMKIPNEGTAFNRDMGVLYEDGREKKSKNPYKNPMTPATQKEIGEIIARKGTAFAASLAKAAGKTISGAPLKS